MVQARDMGRTSRSVLIHFMAEELPPSVKMFGILYAYFNFRPKVEVCVNCRQVGHRRDVCHLPNCLTYPGCGQKHPADHPCTPECVDCGDAHMTGDKACNKRFQRGNSRPSRPRQTQQQQQKQQMQQQHEFQLEKESFPRIEDRNRGSGSKSPARSESRSRDLGSQSGKPKEGQRKNTKDTLLDHRNEVCASEPLRRRHLQILEDNPVRTVSEVIRV
ncbi:hypothetical protein HPB49_009861 [Dermacentor silvarum]|uniref:Uncharacterized protein n=1 Tax=Dermacentor silvarum TaxID=543639 RepID=A0ACB8CR11_DERSI|nr:hypothetical protein HPB49_009861 [Dermacentor silvarum]